MDHFFQIPIVGEYHEPMLEGYTFLGFAAGLSKQAKLQLLVTGVTYRHPGLLAKTISTLDVLSGGRARLGIGAAWNEQEHQGLGVPFPSTSERFERLGETLEICEQMWGSDDGPYAGRHYQLAETVNSPTNVSTPTPEVMIGGMGPNKTLRLAAQHAGSVNWFPVGEADFLAAKDHLARHCATIGRDPATIRVTLTGFLMGRDGADEFLTQMEQYAAWGVEEVFVAPVANDPRVDVQWWVEELIPRLASI
jgi:F420-dependent oxidoreductase-like protein